MDDVKWRWYMKYFRFFIFAVLATLLFTASSAAALSSTSGGARTVISSKGQAAKNIQVPTRGPLVSQGICPAHQILQHVNGKNSAGGSVCAPEIGGTGKGEKARSLAPGSHSSFSEDLGSFSPGSGDHPSGGFSGGSGVKSSHHESIGSTNRTHHQKGSSVHLKTSSVHHQSRHVTK